MSRFLFRQIVFLWLCTGIVLGWSTPLFADEQLVMQIRRIKPSVVAIGTSYFKDSPKLRYRGTGFAVGNGRLIVTNAHVIAQIEKDKRLGQLRLFHEEFPADGLKASLLEKDEVHDLALLEMQTGRLPALKLGGSEDVREGEAVAFTGYPIGFVLGLNPTTHAGIVSAISPIVLPSPKARTIKKELVEHLRHPYEVFQLDATAFPGNSGSPVFRISTGEVIGVINMVFVKGKKEHLLKEPTGITYAIPSGFVRALVGQ